MAAKNDCLKTEEKNTGPDNIIEHFNCLKRNIRARYIINCIDSIRSVYSLFKLIAYRHTCTVDASYLLFKLLRSD